MTTAAVIVHYGQHAFTRRLLESLSFTNIVVTRHSEYDGPAPEGTVFLDEPNRGYAAGLNLAARHLQEHNPEVDSILAMNPDIDPDPAALERLIEIHRHEAADATFPSVKEDRILLQGYTVSRRGTIRRVSRGSHLFPGTCFVFSMDGWRRLGGFSEEYFHYFEDLDYCERLHRQGGRICHADEVVVNHAGKSGASFSASELPRYAVRNHLLFVRRFGEPGALAFGNICLRHLLYLFRWPGPWHGLGQWYAGVREYLKMSA